MSFGIMADFWCARKPKLNNKVLGFQNNRQFFSKWNARHARFSSEKPTADFSRNVKLTWNFFPNNKSLKAFLWTLWMLFWQTCGKTPTEVQNFSTKLPEKHIPSRNHLFSSKQSYGHVDAVLSKLVKRYWRIRTFSNQSHETMMKNFFFEKVFQSKCSFWHLEYHFDSSAEKT